MCLNQVCVLTGTRKPRSTHIKSRVQTDLNSATSTNPQKTRTIEAIFNTFLAPPDGSIDRRYRRVIVGKNDLTLFPLIRPGAILKIDTHKRAIATYREWSCEFDRPIYILYTREGYVCSWCELDETGSWLTTVPHVCSKTPHRHLRYGQEVEVVGRAVGLIMNLEG